MAEAGRAVVQFVGDYSQLQTGLASTLAPAKLGKMGKLGGLAIGGALTAAVAAGGIGKALHDIGKELDGAYDTIRVGTGATGKQLDALKADFRSVAKQVPADLGDTGTAIADLNTRLGLTGKPLRRMARQMLELSEVTGDDLQGSIKGVARAFVDWEVPVRRQTKTLDGFFRLSQASGSSVEEITSLIQQFGSPLRTLGFNVDEAAAMFANFERAGVNIETMVPGLKLAIGNLSSGTGEAGKQMEKFDISGKNLHDSLFKIFRLISKDGLPTQDKMNLAMGIFGKRAGADMREAISQGRFNLEKFVDIMKHGKDTIHDAAKDTRDADENFKILANRLKVAVAPAADAVYGAIGDLTGALAEFNLEGKKVKGLSKGWTAAMYGLAAAVKAVGAVYGIAFDLIKNFVSGVTQILKGLFSFIKGWVKVVTGVFTGDWKKAWSGVKDMFRGGKDVIVGALKAATSPIRAATKGIGRIMSVVFEGAWNTVSSIFRKGANAVIDVVRAIIDVINLIPGVKIGSPDKIADPKHTYRRGENARRVTGAQRGGVLEGGAPSGDSIPAMLERGEYVLNRKAVQKVGVSKLDRLNFQQASRFQSGGRVGMFLGGLPGKVAGAAGEAAALLTKGPKYFIDKLPHPNLPDPLGDLGPWLIDKTVDYIKSKVTGGIGGTGGSIVALGRALQSMGYEIGEHPAFGGVDPVHTTGSAHYSGRAIDVNDDVPPFAHGSSEMASLDWLAPRLKRKPHSQIIWRNRDIDTGAPISGHMDHLHFAMRKGGLVGVVRRMARGGWFNRVGSHWDNDELASLAHAAGMKSPGLMAQIANGESSGNPRAVGNDPGGTTGLGLWQITTGYNDDVIAQFGGQDAMFNPLKNAQAAKVILDRQGVGAWYAPPRGPRGKVINSLAQMLRRAMKTGGGGGAALGGADGKKKAPEWKGSGGTAVPPGQRPPTSEQVKAAHKAIKEANRKAVQKARNAVRDRLSGRGGTYPLKDRIGTVDKSIARVTELIDLAQARGSAESGPGGSDVTADELQEQTALTRAYLGFLLGKDSLVSQSIAHVRGVRKHFDKLIRRATPKGSKSHWKLGAFKQARGNANSTLTDLLSEREGLVGLTGQGGAIAAAKLALADLGFRASLPKTDTINGFTIGDILQIAEASRLNVFDALPKAHTGADIIGPAGSEVPVMVQSGERIVPANEERPIVVQANFANGMEWLARFVSFEIEQSDRKKHQQIRAGA